MPNIKQQITELLGRLDGLGILGVNSSNPQIKALADLAQSAVPDDDVIASATQAASATYRANEAKATQAISNLDKALASKQPLAIFNSVAEATASLGDLKSSADALVADAKAKVEEQKKLEEEALKTALGAPLGSGGNSGPSDDNGDNEGDNHDNGSDGDSGSGAGNSDDGGSGNNDDEGGSPSAVATDAFGSMTSHVFKSCQTKLVEGVFGLPDNFKTQN